MPAAESGKLWGHVPPPSPQPSCDSKLCPHNAPAVIFLPGASKHSHAARAAAATACPGECASVHSRGVSSARTSPGSRAAVGPGRAGMGSAGGQSGRAAQPGGGAQTVGALRGPGEAGRMLPPGSLGRPTQPQADEAWPWLVPDGRLSVVAGSWPRVTPAGRALLVGGRLAASEAQRPGW